jgi:hypothetical protein
VVSISVDGPKREWQSLQKKISRGTPLEEAAAECGIPLEEVFQYITDRSAKVDTMNFELRMFAQGAVKNAMAKLSKLAEGEQRVRSQTDFDDEGKPVHSKTMGPDDLEAAKTLARFALDALKLARVGGAPRSDSPEDLFDKSADDNPWALKKVE